MAPVSHTSSRSLLEQTLLSNECNRAKFDMERSNRELPAVADGNACCGIMASNKFL